MSSAEIKYPIHEKEQLAVVHALLKWRVYLHSTVEPFTVYTDHESLKHPRSPTTMIPSSFKSRTTSSTSRKETVSASLTYPSSRLNSCPNSTTVLSLVIMVSTRLTPACPHTIIGQTCPVPSSTMSSRATSARSLRQERQKKMGYYSRFRSRRGPGPMSPWTLSPGYPRPSPTTMPSLCLSTASTRLQSSSPARPLVPPPNSLSYFSSMLSLFSVSPSPLSLTTILASQVSSGPASFPASVQAWTCPPPTISKQKVNPNAPFRPSSSIYAYTSPTHKTTGVNSCAMPSLPLTHPSPPQQTSVHLKSCTVIYLKSLST